MTSREIDKIIRQELMRMTKNRNAFLQHGLMGACIFLFWYHEETRNEKYRDLAYEQLDKVYRLVSTNNYLEINNGLCGIALGLLFLIKKNYVKGDINKVLREIDDHLYRSVMSKIDNDLSDYEGTLLDVLIYLSIRLNQTKDTPMETQIRERFFLLVLNKLYLQHDMDFYREPLPASSSYKLFRFILLLSEAAMIDVCRQRILHIIEECELVILSQTPYSEGNRLLLYYALCKLDGNVCLNNKWKRYIESLKQSVSVERLVRDELPTNNLLVSKGLSGLFILLKSMPPESAIPYTMVDFYDKIVNSDFYKTPISDYSVQKEFVGLDGTLGLIMLYTYITRNYGKEKSD